MTKKYQQRAFSGGKSTNIKTLEQQPAKFATAICPLNLEEQKERFLKHGRLPKFVLKGSEEEIEHLYNKASNQIRFDLFGEAEHILNVVKQKYGDGHKYLEAMYGEKITKDAANDILLEYLKENKLDGAMSIIWCTNLASSARMMWVGPHAKYNKPEARSYSFWIKNTDDNNFLRECGIRCLADHEIGTHFFRSFNDGLQPWFMDRKRFGVRGLGSLEQLRTEEGLACINTVLNAKVRYLWSSALQYYAACKSAEMTFKQLFDHLTVFVKSPDHRWRLCMRIKRGLIDPNDLGGYGKDQCYFEGAVEILRNIDNIDFQVLMSGKMCVDEMSRCKRLARQDCLRMPAFMKNETKYKKNLKAIANLNGLNTPRPRIHPPIAYIQRLKRGRRIGPENSRKVRKKYRKGRGGKFRVKGQSSDSFSSEATESECEEGSCTSLRSKTEAQEMQGGETIKRFPTESSADSGISSDLDLPHHDAGLDPSEAKLRSNNNNEILNDLSEDCPASRLSPTSLSGSIWSLKSVTTNTNSNICTTVIHQDQCPDQSPDQWSSRSEKISCWPLRLLCNHDFPKSEKLPPIAVNRQ
ncbi:microtubule-associated tyrosine carboxypeptidase-like isoform X3 [Ostrea edulis]|uniref:microtubule-associated tyrosine carboxypeptidase-like isoform X3 n=1 Tax=Ostrea edulis TaxID=37623 RepID=UPI0024AEE571|nr:microtubule-associated tyrosine carboxypeptidase-like isoform X3 [Ostrea edulis]